MLGPIDIYVMGSGHGSPIRSVGHAPGTGKEKRREAKKEKEKKGKGNTGRQWVETVR